MSLFLSLLLFLPIAPDSVVRIYQVPDSTETIFLVRIELSPSMLQYRKADGRYQAEYEVQIELFGGKDLLKGDYWRYTTTQDSYPQTHSTQESINRFVVLRAPHRDRYEIKVRVKDLGSGRVVLERKQKFSGYFLEGKRGLWVSDFVPLDREKYREGEKVVVSPYFSEADPFLFFRGVSRSPFTLRWKLLAEEGLRVKPLEEAERQYPEGPFADTLSIPIEGLTSGSYLLEAQFRVNGRVVAKRTFRFFLYGFNLLSDEDYFDLVDALRYLNPESWEIEELRKAEPAERESLWDAFWKRRDPTPETERNELKDEFLRRVEYANTHFSSPLVKGYKSDRGRVYIKLGPPDEREYHPFELEYPAYEIWYYYSLNLTLVFMDERGIGDYVLVYPRNFNLWDF